MTQLFIFTFAHGGTEEKRFTYRGCSVNKYPKALI